MAHMSDVEAGRRGIKLTMVWSPPRETIRGCCRPSCENEEVIVSFGCELLCGTGRRSSVVYAVSI